MASQSYEIALADIFEGPMDLLVHLIKKNEVDIYDIPIAFITDQFLAYLEWMKSLDIDIAGDFLVMAATLTHIKSRMLLPSGAAGTDTAEEDDPRNVITGPLVEYLQMKSVAEQLAGRPLLDSDVFAIKTASPDLKTDPGEEALEADLMDLLRAYQSLLNKMSDNPALHISFDVISVKEKMTEVIDKIKERGSVPFASLLSARPDRTEIIVTFLAILEVVKLNMGYLLQSDSYRGLRLIHCDRPDTPGTPDTPDASDTPDTTHTPDTPRLNQS